MCGLGVVSQVALRISLCHCRHLVREMSTAVGYLPVLNFLDL